MFRYSLSSFFRFLLGLQLFFAVNYLLYTQSRQINGEELGWPFVFYEWKASVIYYEYWSVWPLLADIAVVVLVST